MFTKLHIDNNVSFTFHIKYTPRVSKIEKGLSCGKLLLRTKEKNSNFMHLIQPSSIYICTAEETNASYDKLKS